MLIQEKILPARAALSVDMVVMVVVAVVVWEMLRGRARPGAKGEIGFAIVGFVRTAMRRVM